jgi:hypothetical protein
MRRDHQEQIGITVWLQMRQGGFFMPSTLTALYMGVRSMKESARLRTCKPMEHIRALATYHGEEQDAQGKQVNRLRVQLFRA